jgi:hypothetical protein
LPAFSVLAQIHCALHFPPRRVTTEPGKHSRMHTETQSAPLDGRLTQLHARLTPAIHPLQKPFTIDLLPSARGRKCPGMTVEPKVSTECTPSKYIHYQLLAAIYPARRSWLRLASYTPKIGFQMAFNGFRLASPLLALTPLNKHFKLLFRTHTVETRLCVTETN